MFYSLIALSALVLLLILVLVVSNMENFELEAPYNGTTTIVFDKPLRVQPIVLLNKYDELKVIRVLISEIPLISQGDVLILSNQKDLSDNGRYIVTLIDGEYATLSSMRILKFGSEFVRIPSERRDVVLGRSKKTIEPGIVYFSDLDVPGYIRNGVAVVYAKPNNESKYECIGNKHLVQRATCESEYDGLGNPKARTIWDRRCQVNTDCPFYHPSTSRRGGCNDNGYCEMPLGVERVGYRKYQGDLKDGALIFENFTPDVELIFENFTPDIEPVPPFPQYRAPEYELNDDDFNAKYKFGDIDQFEWPADLQVAPKLASSLFINDACNALLHQCRMDQYEYIFGKCDRVWINETNKLYYFNAIVCIHAPAKYKGKVIRFDCAMDGDTKFLFREVRAVGSISEGDLNLVSFS